MASQSQHLPWQLHQGPYMGDVSALCLIPSPWDDPLPFLLAGTGAQLLLYDLGAIDLLLSFCVFDGIRIHGIVARTQKFGEIAEHDYPKVVAMIAVHGEKKVKLLDIVAMQNFIGGIQKKMYLQLSCSLPRVRQWILDVRFVKEKHFEGDREACNLLAIGISDNSVHLWDIKQSAFVSCVECTERSLLYSMRLWGDCVDTLHVAAGTIFNEILVWNLRSQSKWYGPDGWCLRTIFGNTNEVLPLRRLIGHQGSIFRIAWSHNGKQLVSVSDDRSARVWTLNIHNANCESDLWQASGVDVQVGPVFYGHSARLWDCHLDQMFLVTASEDCTFRIWNLNGRELARVKAHVGRGIWRCVYDSENMLLITAGADASIKLHSLCKWVLELGTHGYGRQIHSKEFFQIQEYTTEAFCIALRVANTYSTQNQSPLNSKSEYVRCLSLAGPKRLYVTTNQGFLHCVDLVGNGEETCTTIYHQDDSEPIVCLDVMAEKQASCEGEVLGYDHNGICDDWIAVGDCKGRAMVFNIHWHGSKHQQILFYSWPAAAERQLLGVYWCRNLGTSYVFTTDPRGGLYLWVLKRESDELNHEIHPGKSSSTFLANGGNKLEQSTDLLICYKSDFQARIVCLDSFREHELLACGDQRGNIILFSLPMALFSTQNSCTAMVQPLAGFKGSHGVSSVASIQFTRKILSQQVEICSTGKDGCICKFLYKKLDQDNVATYGGIVCVRVENVPAITIVESLRFCRCLSRDSCKRRVAVGFTAASFLLWDLDNESELIHIACGGWRRPHSFMIGKFPETEHCFVYVKDQLIHVHRKWLSESNGSSTSLLLLSTRMHLSSLSLRAQFHGREVHTVHFVPDPSGPCVLQGSESGCWIVTGAEDGSVRIVRYNKDAPDQFDKSMFLGEHVGGSAIKAITLIHNVKFICLDPCHRGDIQLGKLKDYATTMVLLSVGAKEVMTLWLLEWVEDSNFRVDYQKSSNKNSLMLSSSWLSTHIRPTHRGSSKRLFKKNDKGATGQGPEDSIPLNVMKSEPVINESGADDWRYLATTAFCICCPYTRSMTFFVVTSSSNASLNMYAFPMWTQTWIEIAVLVHHKTLVLTLQHLIIPSYEFKGSSDLYLVFSGATDGSIVLWDVSKIVSLFTRNCSSVAMGKAIAPAHRPPTGRGSQGGKRWSPSTVHKWIKGNTISSKKDMANNVERPNSNTNATCLATERKTTYHRPHIYECGSCSSHSLPSFDKQESAAQFEKERSISSEKDVIDCDCMVRDDSENFSSLSFESGYDNPRYSKSVSSFESDAGGPLPASEVHPLHVLNSAHQSGVNCLFVSVIKRSITTLPYPMSFVWAVISGGDDQALHIATFAIENTATQASVLDLHGELSSIGGSSNDIDSMIEICHKRDLDRDSLDVAHQNRPKGSMASDIKGSDLCGGSYPHFKLVCLSQEILASAHNSAIKGIWTDGDFVFTIGLDQRLRCWNFVYSIKGISLMELSQSVVNVPEPAALHVKQINRSSYWIAVVGRGLQIIDLKCHD